MPRESLASILLQTENAREPRAVFGEEEYEALVQPLCFTFLPRNSENTLGQPRNHVQFILIEYCHKPKTISILRKVKNTRRWETD